MIINPQNKGEEEKMKNITHYKTITADNFEELDKKVNESINEGLQPFGNPYVTEQEIEGYVGNYLACQAMVKVSQY